MFSIRTTSSSKQIVAGAEPSAKTFHTDLHPSLLGNGTLNDLDLYLKPQQVLISLHLPIEILPNEVPQRSRLSEDDVQ